MNRGLKHGKKNNQANNKMREQGQEMAGMLALQKKTSTTNANRIKYKEVHSQLGRHICCGTFHTLA